MNIHVSYKAGKTPDLEREFQHQLQKLQRRLRVFKPDLIDLHAIVEQENSRTAGASLNLRLPYGQMTAQKSGENAMAAVKSAFADLLSQVTRHKDVLRGQWTRKSSRRAGREQLTPMPAEPEELARNAYAADPIARPPRLDRRVNAANSDGAPLSNIETWLSANLRKLEDFVDRELEFQVEAERIRQDQITREEVIDEVIVSALSQEDGKTRLLSLDSWFHRLALQAILGLIAANADTGNVSLDAPAGIQNVTGSDESVLQYH
ncbi:MAG TPA: HPF/RaiA family ribosome-associated protein, partial [Candidatus Angelobacter sp.]|nr:HPF/RaiA family ribosome-associated protein [Candidatus Angelobacter sp.]